MFKTLLVAGAAALVALTASSALAAGAFDAGTEGWTSFGNSTAPVWNAGGGNPGGYLSVVDGDDGWAYLSAPATYLAPISTGGTFSFDLRHSAPTTRYPFLYDVRVALSGAGINLISESVRPTLDWASYSFNLDLSGGWRIHSSLANNYNPANPLPTLSQFQSVLGSLTGVYISADYTNGTSLVGVTDITQIDNVRLTGLTAVPEPATWAMLLMGFGGLGAMIRRRRARAAAA